MSAEERHLDWARAWLRQLLADRKQAQSESTARSLASQFRRAEQDGADAALERARETVIEALYRACPFTPVAPGAGCRRCRVCDAAEQVRSLKTPEGGK
jgi:hypothetical protein